MYCLCSDESHDDIMAKQRFDPMPFDVMIAKYTGCAEGCGSCIDELRERFDAEFGNAGTMISIEAA